MHDTSYGWADFVILNKLKKLKEILKPWHVDCEKRRKCWEKELVVEVDGIDSKSEVSGIINTRNGNESKTKCRDNGSLYDRRTKFGSQMQIELVETWGWEKKFLISNLQKMDGSPLMSITAIEAKILGFYTKHPGTRSLPSNMQWNRVSDIQNSILIASFSIE